MTQRPDSTVWLAMWDNTGLECLVNITELDQQQFMDGLKGQPSRAAFNLNAMILRARYNSQRHYEIYTFAADDSMSREDLINQFTACPQDMADLIRERGNKIYSDRQNKKDIVIV